MRSKIVATVILILSIVALFNYYPSLKNYNYIKKGNKNTLAKEFDVGRENYKKSLDIEKNSRVNSNILKSFYFEKKYDEVVKAPADENFLKGNSYAYLGDQDAQNSKSFYEKALTEYKLGMKKSDDINIKKNYELILQKIKESDKKEQNKDNKDQKDKEKNQDKQDQNKNQQQNQNNKQEQNKDQQQDQNNKQEQNRDQNNNTENQSQNQQKQDEKENKNSEQKQDSQKNGDEQKNSNSDNQNHNENKKQNSQPEKDDSKDPQEQKDNSNGNSGQTEGEMSEKEIKEQEIKAILKRLEGNEKQSFKNNERMMNINNNNPSNRW
ncbi:hypothetical protein [Fusobacterium sp.]|uniref:hypothetical protein n=1 Tax=Fusobacterium sp. TaxID=68766 RepID=UPI0025B83D3B|nr:hypothetical protein [Fusobacterium sp.]